LLILIIYFGFLIFFINFVLYKFNKVKNMKKVLLLVSALFLISTNGFNQTIVHGNNTVINDTNDVQKELSSFALAYSKEMESWSKERLEHFNRTFVYTRGNFTIPKEPIQPFKP
jgi:hypothetical protein